MGQQTGGASVYYRLDGDGHDVVARQSQKVGQPMVDQRSPTRASAATRSPLDPFVSPFLRYVATLSDGYAPNSHGRVIADHLDWPPAFVEAVFASARVRGLLEPHYGKRSRGRVRWQVSAEGQSWLAAAMDT